MSLCAGVDSTGDACELVGHLNSEAKTREHFAHLLHCLATGELLVTEIIQPFDARCIPLIYVVVVELYCGRSLVTLAGTPSLDQGQQPFLVSVVVSLTESGDTSSLVSKV